MRSLPALAGLLPPALAAVVFVTPPPYSGTPDSNYPFYQYGSTLDITWAGASNGVTRSLSLLQIQNSFSGIVMTGNDYNFTQGLPANITTFKWTVRPAGNMMASPLCRYQLVLDDIDQGGATIVGTTSSMYFDIGDPPPNTTTTAISTSMTAASTLTTAVSTSTTADSPLSATNSSVPSPQGGSGSTINTTNVGLGVAIPCAVVLGVVASWAIFRRLARRAARRAEAHLSTQMGSDKSDCSSAAELGVAGELYAPAELTSSRETVELDSKQKPAELGSSRDTVELSSSRDAAELDSPQEPLELNSSQEPVERNSSEALPSELSVRGESQPPKDPGAADGRIGIE